MSSGLDTEQHAWKLKLNDLEKQLDVKNSKIDRLQKELKVHSDELAEQVNKNRIVCEARDENKFKIVQLESEIKVLKKENETIKCELKELKEGKNSREVSLETLVASYVDEIHKYQEKILGYETKIAQLENEKSGIVCVTDLSENSKGLIKNYESKLAGLESQKKELTYISEKYRNEVNNLKDQVTSLEDYKIKNEEKVQVYKSKITKLECENKELASRYEKYGDEIRNLKIQLASVEKENLKYEENIQISESKIAELEAEKGEFTSRIKLYGEEVNKLKMQIANLEEYKLRNKGKEQTEEHANNLLQRNLENVKVLCNRLSWTEDMQLDEMTVNGMKSIFAELQEDCKNVVSSFVEQQRKFEKMNEKLQRAGTSLEKAEKDSRELKLTSLKQQNKALQSISIKQKLPETEKETGSPSNLQNKKHQRTAKSERLKSEPNKQDSANATTQKKIVKLEKETEIDKESSPLKPQNKRLYNAAKTQKNTKRNKKVQDENICSPAKEKNRVPVSDSPHEPNSVSVPSRGRNLRSRKKAE